MNVKIKQLSTIVTIILIAAGICYFVPKIKKNIEHREKIRVAAMIKKKADMENKELKRLSIEEKNRINQPVFGIFLGETIESLKKRYSLTHHSEYDYWKVHTREEGIRYVECKVFGINIYEIEISFDDTSQNSYSIMKRKLSTKYKVYNDDDLFSKSTFRGQMDGKDIEVVLNRDSFISESISITYVHMNIRNNKYRSEEAIRLNQSKKRLKKAEAMSDRL